MNLLEEFLTEKDAFWRWDGHKHVAKLASGKLSDFYANCTPIFTAPLVQDRLADDLVLLALEDIRLFLTLSDNIWVVGSAMGAVGFAQSIARTIERPVWRDGSAIRQGIQIRAAYTEPGKEQPDEDDIMSGNDVPRKIMQLKRFDLGEKPFVILCEDVVTTGGTTEKTVKGIIEKHPDVQFFHILLTLVNRNPGVKIVAGLADGCPFDVKALYEHPAAVWVEGNGPKEMNDCIPIRPKEGWKALVTEKL